MARIMGERGGEATWPTDRIVRQPPMVEERKGGKLHGRLAAYLCVPLTSLRFVVPFPVVFFNFNF